jgi:predicted TIM-barrel fold metal-dependent hydrolase
MQIRLRRIPARLSPLIGLFLLFLLGSCRGMPEERFYSIGDFSKVPKVDVHVHINTSGAALLEQAEKDNFVLLTINVDVPDYPPIERQMGYAEALRDRFPGRLYFLSTFRTADIQGAQWQKSAVESLKIAQDKGSVGVKVWKNIGMVIKNDQDEFIQIDDPVFDPVFDFLEENNIPVCGHIGEPRNCWLPLEEMTVNNDRNYYKRHPQYHMYQHPEYPSHEELIGARDQLIDKHPNLKFIGTHLGSMEWSVDEIGKRLDKYPNMAVDLTARISHLQYQSLTDWNRIRDFLIQYQDRIMYGTDLQVTEDQDPEQVKNNAHQTWSRDWQYLVTQDSMENNLVNGKFKGLGLPQAVVDKIYYKNANEWYSLGLE